MFSSLAWIAQDVDNLIDLLIDPWHTVRANWEEHARFLFHEFAGVHRVLQEATFANDEGKLTLVAVCFLHPVNALMDVYSHIGRDCALQLLAQYFVNIL